MLHTSEENLLDFMDKCSASQFSTQFQNPITEMLSLYPRLFEHLDDNGHDVACTIENSLYRVLRNVKNIELYNSIKRSYFHYEILDMAELVLCVRDAVNTVCKTKISVSSCPGPLYIEGNVAIQTHTLLGLIRNAFCYTLDRSSISIHMERTQNLVIIKVSDIGNAIKTEYENRIFDPFFSVNPSGDGAEPPGLGLDLAILERLQQHLGGGRPFVSHELDERNTIAFSVPIINDSTLIGEIDIMGCDTESLIANRYSSLYLQLCEFCRYPE